MVDMKKQKELDSELMVLLKEIDECWRSVTEWQAANPSDYNYILITSDAQRKLIEDFWRAYSND